MRYGTAYMGTHTPEGLRRELEEIKRLGFDEIVLACQENDFMHFTGKIEFCPKIARELGLITLVNLWGFASAFGGGRISRLVADYPEVMVVGPDGKPGFTEWPAGNRIQPGCPNHPLVVERARKFAQAAIDAGADGFFWDEPTQFDCYCSACLSLFRDAGSGDLKTAPEAARKAFRSRSVARWVEEMSGWVKKENPKLVTSTCVMPSDRDAWKDAAGCPSLDSLGTDTYWMLENKPVSWMTEPCLALVEEARKNRKSPHLWLQCWKIIRGRERELVEASVELAKAKPGTIYVWAYRGQLGTTEACDAPDAAWACAVEGLRAIGMKVR